MYTVTFVSNMADRAAGALDTWFDAALFFQILFYGPERMLLLSKYWDHDYISSLLLYLETAALH